MPSGGCTVTPGYNLNPGEKVNNAKLNQGFQPVVQVDEGAITSRELQQDILNTISQLSGKNLLCNGIFQLWDNDPFGPGIIPGTFAHDYGSASRWVVANDANRTVSRHQLLSGPGDDPNNPEDYLHWAQSAPLTVVPGYIGQRLEDVRAFSGLKVVFSILARAAADTTVVPKARQYFGTSAGRTILNCATPGTGGPALLSNANHVFKPADVGQTIHITAPGTPALDITTTVQTYDSDQLIELAYIDLLTPYSGVTAVINPAALASASVFIVGQPVNLVANTWQRIEQVFEIPSVIGQNIPSVPLSFTEFRLEMPTGVAFAIDLAQAQVELGAVATQFVRRSPQEDKLLALRYYERQRMVLSTNVTNWTPFVNLFPKIYSPVLKLTPDTGTGGTISVQGNTFVLQGLNHSVRAAAWVTADAELRD